MGDTANLDDWFTALGITGTTYKIIEERVGTVNGSTLTTTNWGKTQVTAEDANGNFRVIILEVRPKGAVAMPSVATCWGDMFAVKSDGTAWSWGDSADGKLGRTIGSATVPSVIRQQSGTPLANIIQIVANAFTGYALDKDGGVWSWGYNPDGELGNGAAGASQYFAARVRTGAQRDPSGYLQNIVFLAAGTYSAHALSTTGEVLTWGYNGRYALGVGHGSDTSVPVYVTGKSIGLNTLQNIVSMNTADGCTIFLRSDGAVFACGLNSRDGGVGDGTSNNYTYPVRVVAGASGYASGYLEHIVEVAATGFKTCKYCTTFFALEDTGIVYTWGYGGCYQTGLGNTSNYARPQKLQALAHEKIVHLATSLEDCWTNAHGTDANTLAITADGRAYTWGGKNNKYGTLGNGTTSTLHTVPKLTTEGIFNMVTVYGGVANYIGVKEDGSVWGWGYNGYGQLTDGTKTNRGVAIRIGGIPQTALTTLRLYDSRGNHIPSTVTLSEGETLRISDAIKVTISGFNLLTDEVAVSGPFSYQSTDTAIAGVNTNGIVTANANGFFGETTIVVRDADGVTGMIRVRVKPKNAIAVPMVAGAQARVAALKANGTVWGWGRNDSGDAGAGFVSSYLDKPMRVVLADGSPLENIVQIASGTTFTVALRADGTVWTWGDHTYGQLGIGGSSKTPSPYAVQVICGEQLGSPDGYLHDVIRVAACTYSCYAITSAGEVLAWGYGGDGQLGYGNTTNYGAPHYVSGAGIYMAHLPDILDVSNGRGVTMFLRTNGTVFVVGGNRNNSGGIGLGVNATSNYLVPLLVWAGNSSSSSGILENIVEVASSGYLYGGQWQSMYALDNDGKVYSWGYGGSYALGHGNTNNCLVPTKIEALDNEKIIHIAATSDGTNNASCSGGAAMTSDRKIYTWGGTQNSWGQLGNGTFTTLHTTPTLTTSKAFDLLTLTDIYNTGYAGTRKNGTVWGWGGNWAAQLGYKTLDNKSEAVMMHGLFPSIQVNGAAIYRGNSAAAAYGADAGAAGTQCPGEIWLSATPQGSSGVHGRKKFPDNNYCTAPKNVLYY